MQARYIHIAILPEAVHCCLQTCNHCFVMRVIWCTKKDTSAEKWYGFFKSVISSNINLQLLVTKAVCCCTQEWYLGWEKVSCVERCPCFR